MKLTPAKTLRRGFYLWSVSGVQRAPPNTGSGLRACWRVLGTRKKWQQDQENSSAKAIRGIWSWAEPEKKKSKNSMTWSVSHKKTWSRRNSVFPCGFLLCPHSRKTAMPEIRWGLGAVSFCLVFFSSVNSLLPLLSLLVSASLSRARWMNSLRIILPYVFKHRHC